ncbi:MAG: hypothetical protein L3J02_04640 [Henriciella sp.]|nr:hypothetical protein [Henriciella sp.]
MSKTVFEIVVTILGLGFMAAFAVIVVPPLLASGDVAGAFAAGFALYLILRTRSLKTQTVQEQS